MSDLDDYDSILREADVQFGDSPIEHRHDEHAHDQQQQLQSHENQRDRHVHHQGHGHVPMQNGGMMDDEQDDTDFIVLEDENTAAHVPTLPHPNLSADDQTIPLANVDSLGQEGATDSADLIPVNGKSANGGIRNAAASGSGSKLWADKKDKQRAQNRKAAEKSRSKKRGEQMALEAKVAEMQDENAQLRTRLASLLAARSPGPQVPDPGSDSRIDQNVAPSSGLAPGSPSIGTTNPTNEHDIDPSLTSLTAPITGSGIDYAYISKLQTELTNAKTILLERTVELSALRDANSNPSNVDVQLKANVTSNESLDTLRKEILGSTGKLAGLEAEESSLHTLLTHLKSETESLIGQRERIREQLEAKRQGDSIAVDVTGTPDAQESQTAQAQEEDPAEGHVQAPDQSDELVLDLDAQVQTGGEASEDVEGEEQVAEQEAEDARHRREEKALLDIRGWIDAAVKDWDQALPQPKEGADLVRELEEAELGANADEGGSNDI